MRRFHTRGFTLIELLVVIAIIAILASIILASLNTARSKSRDARRVADLKQVQLALELYNNDNSKYPLQGVYGNLSGISATLVPTYISALPSDPCTYTYSTYTYNYASLTGSGSTATLCTVAPCNSYALVAQLESATPASTFSSSYQGTDFTGTGSVTTCGTAVSGGYYCVRP